MQIATTTPLRTHIIVLTYLEADGLEKLASFRASAAALLARHDIRIERSLLGKGKGQLLGYNPWDVPELIQILSVPSLAAFQAYTMDPEYRSLAAIRDQGIRRMVAVVASPNDVSGLSPESTSDLARRLYGVAFVNFKPAGAKDMAEFNRRAKGLFERHGMHIEAQSDVVKVVVARGDALLDFAPERVVVFYLDDPKQLQSYVSDPEYSELAPIRDRGLAKYDFFSCGVAT